MSGTLNKVMLIGNLGKDPEIKTFEGGNSLARFPLATSETYTNRNGERITQTEWHTVVVRGGLAGVAEKYLHKGDKVFIEGRIKTRSWEDQSGERKYATEINADNMTMLGAPSRDNQGAPGSQPSAAPAQQPSGMSAGGGADIPQKDEEEDDLPF